MRIESVFIFCIKTLIIFQTDLAAFHTVVNSVNFLLVILEAFH